MRLEGVGRRISVFVSLALGAALAVGAVGVAWSARAKAAAAADAMIQVPGGRIFVGLRPGKGPEGNETGKLEEVRSFWIDKTEVTTEKYLECVRAKACGPVRSTSKVCNLRGKRNDHPANCVDWKGADAFCRWAGKRLPTNAEWERAARGDDERPYPWGTAAPADQLCWDRGEEKRKTTCAVGSFPKGASPYGVLDMAGNVAEWTSSADGKGYTYKGGGFFVEALAMGTPDWLEFRTEQGSWLPATREAPDLGFRCVRDEPASGSASEAKKPLPATSPGAPEAVTRPAPGSPERKALLDAVRAKLNVTSEFKVAVLTVAGDWAYFEGQEHKSDGRVAAALLHRSGGVWTAEEIAADISKDALPKFRNRLQSDAARHLPGALFNP